MKIEQKAEAYDEAIRKAKDMLTNKEVRQEDMEYLFPELKEDEDERIKKAAVAFVKASNHFNYHLGISKEQVLAWLEKQGKSEYEAVREEKVDSQKMINKIIKEVADLVKVRTDFSAKEVADLVSENIIFCKKEVLTSDEAARYLGMSKSYLYKLTMKKEIPHYKPLGKMCYFNRQELEAWLQSNRVAMDVKHLTK